MCLKSLQLLLLIPFELLLELELLGLAELFKFEVVFNDSLFFILNLLLLRLIVLLPVIYLRIQCLIDNDSVILPFLPQDILLTFLLLRRKPRRSGILILLLPLLFLSLLLSHLLQDVLLVLSLRLLLPILLVAPVPLRTLYPFLNNLILLLIHSLILFEGVLIALECLLKCRASPDI